MLSIPHLIVVFIVVLVIFGPQKLPELARNFGKIMAEFKRATADLRGTFEDHLRELEREAQTLEQKKTEAQRALEADKAAAPPDGTVPTSTPSPVPLEGNPDAPKSDIDESVATIGEQAGSVTDAARSFGTTQPSSSEAVPKPAEDNV
jgi:sec-independent protein translocase protein TatB